MGIKLLILNLCRKMLYNKYIKKLIFFNNKYFYYFKNALSLIRRKILLNIKNKYKL